LHAPLTELKRGSDAEDGQKLVEAVQRLFKLEVEQTSVAAAPRQEDAELAQADSQGRRS
jgi:hypothetical protein